MSRCPECGSRNMCHPGCGESPIDLAEQVSDIESANDSLATENLKLIELLERFCTKSNGLSMYFRATWRPDKMKERIQAMYEFQCECEAYIQKIVKE